MKWKDRWSLSLRNIFSAPARSLLTVLGMAIGVGAILAVLTLGTAGRNQVRAEMARLGIDRVWISGDGKTPLMQGDGALLAGTLNAAALEQFAAPVEARGGDKEASLLLVGCTQEYLQSAQARLLEGRTLYPLEWKEGGNVMLLGEEAARELELGPGQIASLAGAPFWCVGVVRAEDGASQLELNRAAFVPLQTLADETGCALTQIVLIAGKEQKPQELARRAEQLLWRRRGVAVSTVTMQAQGEAAESVIAVFVDVLKWVAFICTLVGGIGVMNILFVSVRERRREIGVMKALGAAPSLICGLFLMEALIYAAVGGAAGVLIGIGLIQAAAGSIGLAPVLQAGDCAAVLLAALTIGLLFGVLPAFKASRLRPADALREE